jgi:uncharacterized protein YhaN
MKRIIFITILVLFSFVKGNAQVKPIYENIEVVKNREYKKDTNSVKFNKSQSIQREQDLLARIKNRQFAKEHEQENLDLLRELYDAVNTIQALRKYHYEMRYDKKYLKSCYPKHFFYGLYPENNWEKDKDRMNKRLSECIYAYNEQYRECRKWYSWAQKLPSNLYKDMDIDNLPEANPPRSSKI